MLKKALGLERGLCKGGRGLGEGCAEEGAGLGEGVVQRRLWTRKGDRVEAMD